MTAKSFIGCAGWSIPKGSVVRFMSEGSHLERYARVLPAVEINSSFYRPHRQSTYVRWAESVPTDFRFCVKAPKAITHERRLQEVDDLLRSFLDETAGLGVKLGCLLVQLPPSLKFDDRLAETFFQALRKCTAVPVACEPRHSSWFSPEAEAVLWRNQIARVAADPSPVQDASQPAGWNRLRYYRCHGSPRIYYSAYGAEFLGALAKAIESQVRDKQDVWCIFDNTALGAATGNAVSICDLLQKATTNDACVRVSTRP